MTKDLEEIAIEEINKLGLNPKRRPLGEHRHHTDVDISQEDAELGLRLAWFLGTMWCDVTPHYFYNKITSIVEWSRVARALRIHGLRISNQEDINTFRDTPVIDERNDIITMLSSEKLVTDLALYIYDDRESIKEQVRQVLHALIEHLNEAGSSKTISL